MGSSAKFQGLRTLIFRVKQGDLKRATEWYTRLLERRPYFEEPFYVGFSVGGFEFGLDPNDEPFEVGTNVETYWGVPKIEKALAECVERGAEVVSGVRDAGGEIRVATVRDPFGNVFGLIENPHFKLEN